jgi:hypothetical protein
VVRLVTLLLLLVTIALPGLAARAQAGEHASICHDRSVRDVMAQELHKRDYYARVIPDLIAEVPDAGGNSVVCDVMDWTVVYDARVVAGAPIGHFERHLFRVRAVMNGFVVGWLR